jgi:hypothetical protein
VANRSISARHALTEQEARFVQVWLGFGRKNGSEAYRRAFAVRRKDGSYCTPDSPGMTQDELLALPELTTKEAFRRANVLLETDYIVRYAEETSRSAGDLSRDVLAEQAMFAEDEGIRRHAAQELLKQEHSAGLKDDAERWVEIMREIGAEIEVPLPDRFRKEFSVTCDCGKEIPVTVDEPLFAVAPLAEMFPPRG